MAKQTIAALIVIGALLAVSGVVVADQGTQQVEEPTTNISDTAEKAYVTDDGDVVLVYDTGEPVEGSGEVTVDVSESHMSGMYQVLGLNTDVQGSFSGLLNRSTMDMDGMLSMPRPEAVDSLQVELDSTTSESESRTDASLDAAMTLPEDQQMLLQLFDRFETTGEVEVSGTSITTTGNADWSATIPGITEQDYDYQLQSTDGGHVLEVEQNSQISEFQVDMWDTEEKALEQLRSQFDGLTEQVDGSTEFTMESYSFEETEQGARLQVEYTVQIEGLNELIQESMVQGFTQSTTTAGQPIDVDESALREQLSDLSIEQAGVSVTMDRTGGSASWSADVENYDALAKAYFSMLEAQDETGVVGDQVQRMEQQLEAMQAADYAQTASWEAIVESDGETGIVADATFQTRTDNWEAYLSERDARDLPPVGTQDVTMTVATEGDRIVSEGSFLLQQDGMYTRTLETMEQQFEQIAESSEDTSTEDIQRAMDVIRDVGFQQARMDASVNSTAATVEGSVSVENLSALTSMVDEEIDAGSMEYFHMTMGEDGQRAVVRMNGAIEGDSDEEAAIQQLGPVTEETNVNMPDEWESDSRTVPLDAMESTETDEQSETTEQSQSTEDGTETTDEPTDTTEQSQSTEDGTETTEEPTDEEPATTTGGPGFGAVTAGVIVFLVSVVALGRTRR